MVYFNGLSVEVYGDVAFDVRECGFAAVVRVVACLFNDVIVDLFLAETELLAPIYIIRVKQGSTADRVSRAVFDGSARLFGPSHDSHRNHPFQTVHHFKYFV